MLVLRLGSLIGQFVVALVLIWFFSILGAVENIHEAFLFFYGFTRNTLLGNDLFLNFYGISGAEVWYTARLMLCAIVVSLILAYAVSSVNLVSRQSRLRIAIDLVTSTLGAIPEPLYVVGLATFVLWTLSHTNLNIAAFPYGPPTLSDTWIPALALALPGGMYLCRNLTMRIEDELEQPYITVARAKGLQKATILRRHLLPHAVSVTWKQLPFVVSILSSTALFTEFFMSYQGALSQFTNATGWNMVTGVFGTAQKSFHLPPYQIGLTFLIGALLLLFPFVVRLISDAMYALRFGRIS